MRSIDFLDNTGVKIEESRMKLNRNIPVIILSILLSSIFISGAAATLVSAQTQETRVALDRGYRTGYSDGYMAGYRDIIDSLAKDRSRHDEYSKADRAFNKDYGTIEDYRDGYKQGFEAGYETGFEKKTFESSLPADLKPRAVPAAEPQITSNNTSDTTAIPANVTTGETPKIPAPDATTPNNSSQSTSPATIVIPRETELIIEIQDGLNTEQSREGERFTAKIMSPSEIAGATIEGRVSKIVRPGRIKRRAELVLSFDRIILSDNNRWSNFSAMLTEVLPVKGDNVNRVDTEGTAIGQSSLKNDAIKVGGATGAGLVTGAVVGGPVGAAVGAGVGAAFGVGAVVIERGKHIRLNRNQQLRIKTAYEIQIK